MRIEPTKKSPSPWLLVGLGSAAAIGIASLFQGTQSVFTPRIETRLHTTNKRGVVEADPEGLARASGYPLDVYALASCMQSEEKTDKGRLAVGLAAWNAARKNRRRIPALMLTSKRADGNGHFGSQAGRYAATSHPPTAKTLQLAAAIVEGRVADITNGAIQWDAPKAQDANHQLYLKNPEKYPEHRYSSKDIEAKRTAEGRRMVMVPGVPDTRFWARVA
jgi:hypothetical protein